MIKKYIPIIFIGILLALIIAGYFFSWPKFQEFIQKRKEISVKDEEIATKQEYLLKLDAFSEKLLKYTDEVSKVESALPNDASVAALFNFFQKASSENGLIITEIDIGGLYSLEESVEKIKQMPFSITVFGSYPAFKKFLHAVYINARIIEVKSIEFSFDDSETAKELFKFNLQLETHGY